MTTSKYQNEINEIICRMAVKMMRTPGTAPLVSAVFRNMLTEWCANSRIKKTITFPVQRLLSSGRASQGAKPDSPPTTVSIAGDVGQLITLFASRANEERTLNLDIHDGSRGDHVRDFLSNTDFGEILEFLEGSEEGALKTMEAFNEHLWNYPAKFATIAATLVPISNIIIKALCEFLRPIEKNVGPDLLADIILTIFRDINGVEAGKLVNTVREVIRRIHTGSLLVGKGDKSLLEINLSDQMKDYLSAIDPELAKKAPVYYAEIKEIIANAVSDSLSKNPEVLLAHISSLGQVKSLAIRAKTRKVQLIQNVDKDGFDRAVSESVGDLDTYEIAEFINTIVRVIDRIHDSDPDIILNVIRGVVDSIDTEKINKTAKWLVPDLMEAVKPLAAAVMPLLVKGVNDLLRDENGIAGEDHRGTVKALEGTLNAAGGVR